jgi:hypothetical protein
VAKPGEEVRLGTHAVAGPWSGARQRRLWSVRARGSRWLFRGDRERRTGLQLFVLRIFEITEGRAGSVTVAQGVLPTRG